MKKTVILLSALFCVHALSLQNALAQFRTGDAKLNTLEQMKDDPKANNQLGGLFDANRFSMHQSYSFTYTTGPTGSAGLSIFTNTFSYLIDPNVQISADVSAVYSPFSSFGDKFSKSVNGVYLSNARLDWKLGEKTFLTVAYSRGPLSSYPYGGSSIFEDQRFGTGSLSPFRTSTLRIDH